MTGIPTVSLPTPCTAFSSRSNRGSVKYVALLAFNKIVVTHPFLVSQQEDVILDWIDSEDITIRIKALDLVQGMVSPDNLVSIVSRLMKQLRACQPSRQNQDSSNEWIGDSDEDGNDTPPRAPPAETSLPEEYQVDIIGRILLMCSQNNYSSIVDFDWYIDVLTQLVRLAPTPRSLDQQDASLPAPRASAVDVAETIGNELRNVAVKVRAMRGSAVTAADLIVRQLLETPSEQHVSSAALTSIAWVLGEYATSLADPDTTIGSLLQLVPRTISPTILTTSLQAVMKIFSFIAGDTYQPWTAERKSRISLLIARILDALDPMTQHPNLEVQERAVEFVELLRLTSEAVAGHAPSTDEMEQDPPLLLTQAIPSLFSGWDLNSVAVGAQANVPMPEGIDLNEPLHPNLEGLLAAADMPFLRAEDPDDFDSYYYQKPAATSISSDVAMPAIARLGEAPEEITPSYQQTSEDAYLDPDILARRKAEREERNRDDPFYIGGGTSRSSTPIHRIIQSSNEHQELDIDSIPIMQLDIDKIQHDTAPKREPRPAPRRTQVVVAADETLSGSGGSTPRYDSEDSKRRKKQLLHVPSSALGALNLGGAPAEDVQAKDDEEMARAMKEVERLRLEMQRANERIGVAKGVDAGGTVVKKKTRKKKKVEGEERKEGEGEGSVVRKKKKKKKPVELQE